MKTLPQYYVIKRDEKDPRWQKYVDRVNKLSGSEFIYDFQFVGYDGNGLRNGYEAWYEIELFKNNPTIITLDDWEEATAQEPTPRPEPVPTYPVPTAGELRQMDGVKVRAETTDHAIIEGEICVEDDFCFILHNNKDSIGSYPEDMRGYKYSWYLHVHNNYDSYISDSIISLEILKTEEGDMHTISTAQKFDAFPYDEMAKMPELPTYEPITYDLVDYTTPLDTTTHTYEIYYQRNDGIIFERDKIDGKSIVAIQMEITQHEYQITIKKALLNAHINLKF